MYIYPNYYKYQIHRQVAVHKNITPQPAFNGLNIKANSEAVTREIEYSLRVLANKISWIFTSKRDKELIDYFSKIKPEANAKYLEASNLISRHYSSGKIIDVNIEDKILENIAQKGESVIFIMNHSNQSQDPGMLAVLNTLLTDAYKSAGQENNFPLTKIILNQDILTSMNKKRREAFKAFGAVGIDASILSAKKETNARAFLPLLRDFIKNKSNIFIFPEGRLAIRKDLPLHERFQIGTAEIVNKIVTLKKNVTVVPVGFSYGKGKNKKITGLHIGTPISFSRDKSGRTTTTAGEILKSRHSNQEFISFFEKHKDEENIIITENGHPVRPEDATDFIKSILCENLKICSLEAKDRITKIQDSKDVKIV